MHDYEELEELSARGAERVVKLYKERASGRKCVVRTIPTAKLHADKLRMLWCKRIELLHRLRGPGLARVNIVFFDGDALYEEFAYAHSFPAMKRLNCEHVASDCAGFCGRYYAGGDLASWLERYPPSTRDLPTQIRLLRELLVGLASLHSVSARTPPLRPFCGSPLCVTDVLR